jgi:hypothetical protein
LLVLPTNARLEWLAGSTLSRYKRDLRRLDEI